MPQVPGPGVRQHDEVDEAHDLLLEQKALDHGDKHRRRQVEEVERPQCSGTSGPHGELSVRVVLEEQSLDFSGRF